MNEENKTPEILVRLAISGCEDANIVASIDENDHRYKIYR